MMRFATPDNLPDGYYLRQFDGGLMMIDKRVNGVWESQCSDIGQIDLLFIGDLKLHERLKSVRMGS